MTDGPTNPQKMQAALDHLAEQLAGSDFRAGLTKDPKAAATAAGVDVGALPDGLLATLGLMSEEELQVVARVHRSLAGSFSGSPSVAILF